MALRWRWGNVGLLVLGAAVIALPWYRAVHTLQNVEPVKPVATPNAVVWGARVFSSPAELQRWLHVRGASFRVWSGRHPHAARNLGR